MQMVKLVFSDSLICAISHNIRHNFPIWSETCRKFDPKKRRQKLVKTESSNLLIEMKRMLLLYCILNIICLLSIT